MIGTTIVLAATLFILDVTSADSGPQKCEAVDSPDVNYFDVRLPTTNVPDQLTTYVCQRQPSPLPENMYHVVAFEPLIDNKDVMHHMLLFGCDETYETASQQAKANNPHMCGDSDNMCRFFLVQWSMGIEGQICSPPEAGVRLGFNSFKSLALQIHWNNANSTAGMIDSSGFRIYYTSKLRKYDVGNIQVGQNDLEIPPGQGRYPQTGSCSGECTSHWLHQPIFLTRAHIHMHYIGDGGTLQIVRGGKVVQEIVRDDKYHYSHPPAHVFEEPVRILPGDELRLTCIFNTRDGEKKRDRTVYWGEGSDGEMCYAFITYYPAVKDFTQCIQFDKYDICTTDGFTSFGECILPGFLHTFESGMAGAILENCGKQGNENTDTDRLCSGSCANAIREVTDHPCMQDRLGKQARRVLLPTLDTWADVSKVIDAANLKCQYGHFLTYM